MSPMKCPACGQRILNPAGMIRCPNCDASLMPQITMSPYAPDAHDDFSSQPNLDDNSSSSEDSDLHSEDTAPFPSVAPTPIMTTYPKNFPKRLPDCEGTVILLETHEEPKRSNSAGEIVFNTLTDFIWSIPGGSATSSSLSTSKEKDKVHVTRIRIRDDKNVQSDIRIEGRLTGVNVAQGDRVSLWGKEKKGLLKFEYGYNHTTRGPITAGKAASPISGLLLVLVGVLGIIVLAITFLRGHRPF